MNITRLMPRFGKSADPDFTEEELDQQDADARKAKLNRTPKNGPVRPTWWTNGQYRRMLARDKKTEQRKANSRYRRRWMKNQISIAALRGQLETVAAIKTPSGQYLTGQSVDLMRNVHNHLELVYGSVDAAKAHYDDVLASAA